MELRNLTQLLYGRMEFVRTEPNFAIPLLVVLCIATVEGTIGNILILIAVATRKNLHNVESIFIVNLACSDLYVTAVADPMSIVGKLEGIEFFDSIPGLCRAIGTVCTVSCVASLFTIAAMSCNRYVYIVHNHRYKVIFKPINCLAICSCFYLFGLVMVLLNLADIGDHGFDHKSLECIWDRMATFEYTIVLSTAMVWVPILITGASYLHMYLHVRAVRWRVHNNIRGNKSAKSGKSGRPPSYKLAKTLFIIYMVFSVCWIPYAILMVTDTEDKISRKIYLLIVVFAHLHPSLNWLVYYFTNRKFNTAFNEILHLSRFFALRVKKSRPAQSSAVAEGVCEDKRMHISMVSVAIRQSAPA